MTSRTVLLTLAGPMQSWGNHPRGSQIRPTSDHPSKAGVIGLVANVLGRDRADDISDLAALGFAVRADRPGVIDADFQTAGGGGRFPLLPAEAILDPRWRKAAKTIDLDDPQFPFDYVPQGDIGLDKDGALVGKPRNASLTQVQYIADAIFTAALTGDAALIEEIATALQHPARVPFLGRAAYLPSEPLLAAVTDHTIAGDALREHPLHALATTVTPVLWEEVAPMTAGSTLVADQPVHYGNRTRVGRAEERSEATPPGAYILVDFNGGEAQLVPPADFFTGELIEETTQT